MKKLSTLLFAAVLAAHVLAQVPQQIAYQAILRDNAGTVQANTTSDLGIAIVQGSPSGTVVYEETHNVTSNGFGLVNVNIGAGTVISGTFAGIDWASGPYFVRTSLDGT
ncbi:MAG: hypothetical protein JST45_08600, partial [Bacteroidetes bacterium]|nr:hypothetical protein [Bacteroidota bacterium]